MQATKTFWLLIGMTVLALLIHAQVLDGDFSSLGRRVEYAYDQTVVINGAPGRAHLSMHIPRGSDAVAIRDESFETADLTLKISDDDDTRTLSVAGRPVGGERHVRYAARITTTPMVFRIDRDLDWTGIASDDTVHLAATSTIQSDHSEVGALLARLLGVESDMDAAAGWTGNQWREHLAQRGLGPLTVIDRIYGHASRGLAKASFSGTTDAVTALRLGEASCGGKSRLMVALCRRVGIPSRIVGGVILGDADRKRAHHLWVECRIGDTWVPYDPLNGYYAMLPARFLTLYYGDRALIRHSRGLAFDYGFSSRRESVPLAWLDQVTDASGETAPGRRMTIVPLLQQRNFSTILLAPFALLLIVFARQVIGVESIGTFLPILLGYALLESAWLVTGLQLAAALFMGVAMRFVLTRLNMLHVPRTAIMITFVVLLFLIFSAGLARFDSFAEVGGVVLPLAALAMAVEKFTLVAMDRGTGNALVLLLQTFVLAIGCRAILATPLFRNLTVVFPEVLLVVIALIVMIGHYRGLRWRELWRFRQVRSTDTGSA